MRGRGKGVEVTDITSKDVRVVLAVVSADEGQGQGNWGMEESKAGYIPNCKFCSFLGARCMCPVTLGYAPDRCSTVLTCAVPPALSRSSHSSGLVRVQFTCKAYITNKRFESACANCMRNSTSV